MSTQKFYRIADTPNELKNAPPTGNYTYHVKDPETGKITVIDMLPFRNSEVTKEEGDNHTKRAIIRSYRQGLPVSHICRRFEIGVQKFYDMLREAGVPKRNQRT